MLGQRIVDDRLLPRAAGIVVHSARLAAEEGATGVAGHDRVEAESLGRSDHAVSEGVRLRVADKEHRAGGVRRPETAGIRQQAGVDAAGLHCGVLGAQAPALTAGSLSVCDRIRRGRCRGCHASVWRRRTVRRLRACADSRGCLRGGLGDAPSAVGSDEQGKARDDRDANRSHDEPGRPHSRARADASQGLLDEAVGQQRWDHRDRSGNHERQRAVGEQQRREHDERPMPQVPGVGDVTDADHGPRGERTSDANRVVCPREDEQHGADDGDEGDETGERLTVVDDEGGQQQENSPDVPDQSRRARRHGFEASEAEGEQGPRCELPRARN